MKKTLLTVCIFILIAIEISRVYFIMPFPGSQRADTIDYAYWIHQNIASVRVLLLGIIVYLLAGLYKSMTRTRKIVVILALLLYAVVFYFFHFRFQADKMFLQPQQKTFATAASSKVAPHKLVLGVAINGESKAYPIQYIGYHHQVRDTVGGTPVMITYCTVCRTGRVFSPSIHGKAEEFRLVGMDHFNAMFEDKTTGSWWQQATGRAVAGPLRGMLLRQIPSEQATLGSWLARYPDTRIFEGEESFAEDYASLENFDRGDMKGNLEKRDSSSWAFKSWVIGIRYASEARAYDWNRIVEERVVNDEVGQLPVLITLEKDNASFHTMSRRHQHKVLEFDWLNDSSMIDTSTRSLWTMGGDCIEGELNGTRLRRIPSSQEFWHAWETFYPRSTKY